MDEHALRSLKHARGACPPAEELVAYEALPPDARARHAIDTHVQLCSRCQLVLLQIDEPLAPRLSGPPTPSDLRTWQFKWTLPLAAALFAAIAIPIGYRALRAPEPLDTIRGTEIQPIAPVGSVVAVPHFEWQSPIVASTYRISVYRGSQLVWMANSPTTRVVPEPPMVLTPGEYTWRVEAVDRAGDVRMASPAQAFVVR